MLQCEFTMNRLFLAIAVALVSCASSIGPEEVVGTYIAEYSYGQEELRLNEDHSYVQRITVKGAPGETTHSGHWTYDSGVGRLSLQDALLLDNNFGKLNPNYKKPSDGIWVLSVRKSLSRVTLNWNDDLGVRFEKK
jgi:hypothetical protein